MQEAYSRIKIQPPLTLRATSGQLLSKQVFRIECLANEFIFAGKGTDTDSHTEAPGSHLVEALVGQGGTTEIVVGAQYKLGSGEVNAADIRDDDLPGIAGDTGKTEADG